MIKNFNKFLNENYTPLFEASANQEASWRTEVQEELSCVVFNAVFGKGDSVDDALTKADNPYNSKATDEKTIRLNQLWDNIRQDGEYNTSFQCQVDSMRNWATARGLDLSNYYFVRHASTLHHDEAEQITKRVEDGKKAAGRGIARFKKDNYQKADIYAIKNGADVGAYQKDNIEYTDDTWNERSNWVAELNEKEPAFFGISLKKLSSSIKNPKIIDVCPYTIENVSFESPSATNKSGKIKFTLNDDGRKFEKYFDVRVKSGDSVSIELQGTGTRDGNVKVMFNEMTKGINIEYSNDYVFTVNVNFNGGENQPKYNDVMTVFAKIDALTVENEALTINDIVFNLYVAAKGYKNDYHMTLPYLYLGV